jgi:hypothetical protein
VFYVKGFGIRSEEILFILFSSIPSAMLLGELFLRKRLKFSAQQMVE